MPPKFRGARYHSVVFWSQVKMPKDLNDCWTWTGFLQPNGYGKAYDYRIRKTYYAHRIAYEMIRGMIPEGLQVDHLCRNRACVNPYHMELVSGRENTQRGGNALKTHCPLGHPYNKKNTHVWAKRHQRHCRKCGAMRAGLRRQAEKEASCASE